jgi:S1-C subfamily serine protease
MAKVLQDFSNALADIVADAGKGTVRVEARRRLPATGIIWSAEGVIVTSSHVVERDDNISVGLPDGKTVPATLAGRDQSTDLAVLRAQAKDLAASAQADVDSLRVGHLVLALGRPGESVLSTLGVISAIGEGWHTPAGGAVDHYVQTDVVMYPGFSGGPLVDMAGQVIGLNTSGMLHGVSLVVPVPTLRRVVDALLTRGRIARGYLGVGAQPVRLPAALSKELNLETGLLLVSVEPGSPADQAGLLLGDTLVGLEGQPLRQMDDLMTLLSGDRVGKAVSVRIVRGGKIQDVTVTIGERP